MHCDIFTLKYHLSTLSSLQSHPQLSASLRERLKRSRRSFTSPFSVAKRLCVEDGEDEEDGQQVSAKSRETFNNTPLNTLNVDINRNEARSGSERLSEATHTSLVPQRQQLSREIKDKTETLRRLKMVKMYRSKVSATFFKLSGFLLPRT